MHRCVRVAVRYRTGAILREFALLGLLYVGYTVGRLFASNDIGLAHDHAATVQNIESWFGLDFEATVNQVLTGLPLLEVGASYWYASLHYIVTPIVLIVLWRRAPGQYSYWRRVLVLATAVALLCYLAYPTAPPRLDPGFVDTLADTSHWGWWGSEASAPRGLGTTTNQLAAMPSMHVGWALWSAWAIGAVVRSPRLRALAWAYPVVTTVVIVATANHWWLDAAVGAGLVVLAAHVVRGRSRSIPVPRDVPRVPSG